MRAGVCRKRGPTEKRTAPIGCVGWLKSVAVFYVAVVGVCVLKGGEGSDTSASSSPGTEVLSSVKPRKDDGSDGHCSMVGCCSSFLP
jgi:hypothetical protein